MIPIGIFEEIINDSDEVAVVGGVWK